MQMHSDLIGTRDACEILGIDRATLTRRVAAGKVASHKLPGKTGAYLYSRADIEALREADERAEQAS